MKKGAESGVRTRTPAKAADFKSAASACSAIPARDDDIVPGWGKGSVFEPRSLVVGDASLIVSAPSLLRAPIIG